ncbi:MAG: hypothetical protein WBS22_03665 [Methylocystis sp.]
MLVFVHAIDEFLQLFPDAILLTVCINAHEVIIAGIGVVNVQFFLNIELARLDDHEADFVGIDVGHCWLLIIKRRLRITRAARETVASFSHGNDALMPNLSPQTNRRRKNRFLAVSLSLCRNRDIRDRVLRRSKKFRRIVKRYDLNAADFLVAACIAATVSYWFFESGYFVLV